MPCELQYRCERRKERSKKDTSEGGADKTKEFSPVFVKSTIISIVRAYPDKDDLNERKVNSVLVNGKMKEISSFHLRTKLRAAVVSDGEASLGFKASDIGCHSL